MLAVGVCSFFGVGLPKKLVGRSSVLAYRESFAWFCGRVNVSRQTSNLLAVENEAFVLSFAAVGSAFQWKTISAACDDRTFSLL
jgi:hypothetical protein